MWFILLAIALAVVTAAGLYFRRRVLQALERIQISSRSRRIAGLAMLWLLFGFPILVFLVVAVQLLLGRESLATAPGGVFEWLVVYPFWMSVLIALQSVPFLVLIDALFALFRRYPQVASWSHYRTLAPLAVAGTLLIYTPTRTVIERGDLNVFNYQVGRSTGTTPLRIGFFADLQLDRHTDRERATEVVAAVNQLQADLILVGGDWINSGPNYISEVGTTAAKLRAPLGVMSVRGDHEHFAYRDRERSVNAVSQALANNGVAMLHNTVRFVEHEGKRIALVFVSYNYMYRSAKDDVMALISQAHGADYTIMITHQLDSALAAWIAGRVDLALVAHTHGGQVNPLFGLTHLPIARVETPYVAGRYEVEGTTIIVTSGIGFSIAPFRYAAPASIELIEVNL